MPERRLERGNYDPWKAIPLYAGRYGVTCETCHSVSPKRTKFGLAFQSNYYNWPGDNPPAYHAGFTIFPFSGLVAYNSQSGQQLTSSTDFRTVQLQPSGGFRLAAKHNGGYYIELNAAARGNVPHAGDFGRAVVSVPLAGPQGQLSLSAGQFAPFGYQWDGMANGTGWLT